MRCFLEKEWGEIIKVKNIETMNDEELKDPFLDDASEDEDVDIDGDMDDADGTDDDDDMWDSEEKE